jgi:hypothetical protein
MNVFGFPQSTLLLSAASLLSTSLSAFAGLPEEQPATPLSCVHEMRYESVAGLILVSVTIADSPPLVFVIDSGAAQSSLTDPLLAAALGLQVKESGLAFGIGSSVTRVFVTENVSIRSDGLEILRAPLVVHDIGNRLAAAAGREIHGFLGAELFERFVVEIEPVGRRLLLHDPTTFASQDAGHEVPLEVIDRRPVVHGIAVVKEYGKEVPVRLVVDTGSSRPLSLITKSARHLKPPADQTLGGSVGVVGETRVNLASTQRLQLGPVAAEQVETAWIGTLGMPAVRNIPNLNGILGNQFLSRFRVFFDYHHNRLILGDLRGSQGLAAGLPTEPPGP